MTLGQRLARLNYILIPKSKADRDRFRDSRLGSIVLPIVGVWGSFTTEGRVLFYAAPFVGLIAINVRHTSGYVLLSLLIGLLVGSLVAARTLRLDHATVRVTAPRRVVVGEEVTFTIGCQRQEKEGDRRVAVRIRGPFLPWDGTMAKLAEDLVVGPREEQRTTMRARFIARGLHHLDPFTAAVIAPLGLTCGPRTSSDGVKVYVVPPIANVTKLPLAIASKHQPGGVALASKAGESMDLLGVRPYRPGDPMRDLHARTWARTGMPMVREYQQEYFTRVGVVLDTSERDGDRLEAAIELAAGVIAHLSRGEALIDVLVVGNAVHELTLGRSLGRLDQALELLSTVERGPAIDPPTLLRRLEPYLDRLSTVVTIGSPPPVEAAIRERGLACSTLVIDAMRLKAIQAREPLAW